MMSRELVWVSFMTAALQGHISTVDNTTVIDEISVADNVGFAADYADVATKEWEARRDNGEFTGRVVE